MIDLSAKIEKPGGRRGPLRLQTSAMATATAAAHGSAVKRRVARDGNPEDKFKGYSRKGRVYVASQYADEAGAPEPLGEGRGLSIYKTSADLHAKTKGGSFATTGGMWKGLSVQPKGSGRATLTFRGRSTGSDLFAGSGRGDAAAARRAKKRARFAAGKRLRPIKQSNALKASTVAEESKVNVLRAHRSTDIATADALSVVIGKRVHASLGGTPTRGRRGGATRGDIRVFADIVAAANRGGFKGKRL